MIKLFDVIVKELKTILTSFSILTIIIGGNIIYAFFYPSPYLNDIVVKQKIAIVDDDRTTLSRNFAFNTNATPKIEVASITNMQNAISLLKQNKIYGILHIPSGFERDSIKLSVPKVYYIADNSYFFIHSTIIEGLNNASNALNTDIKIKQSLYNKDISIEDSKIDWDFIPLYNPSIGYLNYIISVILIFILHQTIIMSCGILCGLQNQQFKQGRKDYFCEVSPFFLINARVIAFSIIYFPLFLFYFGFIYDLYNITTFASMVELIIFGLAFVSSTSAFGIFLGSIFNRMEYVPQIVLVMSMPLLFALGFIWPSEMIPMWIKFFMNFIPALPSVDGFLKLNQMGADFSLIKWDFYHLLFLGIFYMLLSHIILHFRFHNIKIAK
ncbi:hypothetical protein CCY99_07200 [Helicobacter sp. 16-1353]|uniref:ABC transporter permease n=1 Tax=Helicobacter sp. 16-1353 TaxID=2004996 RepID=UPI000DCEA6BC|nr:ABC transporter permease [Helicobacter sp. 16-1353]RAX52745.1 hypothetical protein CCY99_07200 [Helicobacter sp. 16-1353]